MEEDDDRASFRDGSPFTVRVCPSHCTLEETSGDVVDVYDSRVSPRVRAQMAEYMTGAVFLDVLSQTITRFETDCPCKFGFWYGVRMESAARVTEDGDGAQVQMFGRVYSKNVPHEVVCERICQRLFTKNDRCFSWNIADFMNRFSTVFTRSRDESEKRRRAAMIMRVRSRVGGLLATYGALFDHMRLAMYYMSDRAGGAVFPNGDGRLPEVDDIHFDYYDERCLSDFRILDVISLGDRTRGGENEIWSEDRRQALVSAPFGPFAKAAKRWKRMLTDPHHERGRAFLMRVMRAQLENDV